MKSFLSKNFKWLAIFSLLATLILLRFIVPVYTIGSESMGSTLPVGTIVVLGDASHLNPTDIITFQQDGDSRPTTHTFLGYESDGSLITKGDANPTPDVHLKPLLVSDVLGKVNYAIFPTRLMAFALFFGVGVALVSAGNSNSGGKHSRSNKTKKYEAQSVASNPPAISS